MKNFSVGKEVYFISFVYIDLKDPSPKKCYVCKGIIKESNETFCTIEDKEHNLKEYVYLTHIYNTKEQADKRAYMINKED